MNDEKIHATFWRIELSNKWYPTGVLIPRLLGGWFKTGFDQV
jgi:hypothetical protein